MTIHIDPQRRSFAISLVSAAAWTAAPSLVRAQASALNLLSHNVHKTVATGKQGGDITEAWAARNKVAVNWLTFDTGPLKERLFREASLGETTIDIGFLLNTQITPAAAALFEPLDDYQRAEPIEDFADFFPGMVDAMKFGGKLCAIPFRHATSGLHYNEALFKERGIAGPPRTIEELAEVAKKLTFTRPDGSRVAGFVIPGLTYPNVVDIARAWNGDFITPDYQVVANEAPMVRAIAFMHELQVAGALPRGFNTLGTEDVNTWMQSGRAAMAITSMGRHNIYNDPAKSKYPGQIKVVPIPIANELRSKFEVAPAKVEIWAMAIPKSSKNKKQAWSLIREMASKQATLKAALNGNGPVRASTYADAGFNAKLPYAAEELRVLKFARAPMPAFDNAQKAADTFKEEAEAAVLGQKTAQQAMDDLVAKVRPMLPAR
jgi:multiple sugar transport system substrate-binding protein